jgi:hypothetical protein
LGVNSGPAWALNCNPATLALVKSNYLGCSIANRYAVKEWNESRVFGSHKLGKSAIGLDFRQMGPAFYRQQDLGVSYGQYIGPSLQAGVKIKYGLTSIPDEKIRTSTLSCDVGFRVRFGKKMYFSAVAKDPIGYHKAGSQAVGASIAVGALYEPDTKWVLSAEVIKPPELRPSAVLGIGIRPSVTSMAWLRFFSNPWKLEMGWAISRGKLQLYSSASYHAQLGISPGVALIRTF